MKADDKILAIIPARAGSQQLPHKNILPFHGKPLLAWSIEAALAAQVADAVVVSTDSEHYAKVAREYGAEVPFLRPATLAGHEAGLISALRYTVEQLAQQGRHYDWVLCLQPTSPLRTATHIEQAVRQFRAITEPKKSLASVYAIPDKFRWVLKTSSSGSLQFLDPELANNAAYSRQNNGQIFMPNGAIFLMSAANLVSQYTEHTYPFIMDELSSVDIDTLEDFKRAEQLYLAAQLQA